MTRYHFDPNGIKVVTDTILPIALGGTGASTIAGAITNLNLVSKSLANQPNDVGELDANGYIPNSLLPTLANQNIINLTGTSSLYVGESADYTITDYDGFMTYTVSTNTRTTEAVSYTRTQLNLTPADLTGTLELPSGTLTVYGKF